MSTIAPDQVPEVHRLDRRRSKKKHVDAHAPIIRQVKTPVMMGSAEVAEALHARVQNLQFIKGLPEPVQKIRATRLWLAEEIMAFAKVYHARRAA